MKLSDCFWLVAFLILVGLSAAGAFFIVSDIVDFVRSKRAEAASPARQERIAARRSQEALMRESEVTGQSVRVGSTPEGFALYGQRVAGRDVFYSVRGAETAECSSSGKAARRCVRTTSED